MALVDFHGLVSLYKLAPSNVGSTTNPSRPPPMPAPKPIRPPSPSVEGSQPRPTKSQFDTPKRQSRFVIHSAPNSTPIAKGSSIRQKQDVDTDDGGKYNSDDYRQFIIQDFERHRVFVGMDDFMKQVLHVPDDWKSQWAEAIKEVKLNEHFDACLSAYSEKCGATGFKEDALYGPLVKMINSLLEVTCKSTVDAVKPKTPQRFIRNDPQKLYHGVLDKANLSPDIIALHEDRYNKLKSEERENGQLDTSFITWAHPLQVLEVKHFNTALVDGTYMPRLRMKEGCDPMSNHAESTKNSRHPKKKDAPKESASAPPQPVSQAVKRPADESSGTSRKAPKKSQKSTPGGASAATEGKTHQVLSGQLVASPRTVETDRQKEVYVQIGKYLLEQFSIPAFRSHATIGLIDRDRIQLYHANRSVILVSSAIKFTSNDKGDGLDKLIAIMIAFTRLSLCDNGILHNLTGSKLFQDNQQLVTSNEKSKVLSVQKGRKLELEKDGKSLTLTYGDVISHEPSLVGRATAVLHATSPKWQDKDLVVKISWPGARRTSESEFLKKAIEEAKRTPDQWAVNHLPGLLFDFDVDFDKDSTHGKVASMLEGAEFVETEKEYKYERRVLRILVQERLYALKTLTDVKEIAQVLLDIACIHWWLREKVGILHRDLSLNNIMYRRINGKVYGVLTDFDLSSWTASLTGDYKSTSQQRTGTPPYMAYELLKGTENLHLYRHDVESLFYIMLILASHHEIHIPQDMKKEAGGVRMRPDIKRLPYARWFDQPLYEALADAKYRFLRDPAELDLSPSFEDFRDWIESIQSSFQKGLYAREGHKYRLQDFQKSRNKQSGASGVAPTFDGETLGGHVGYSMLIDSARGLRGELEGLIVRYDTTPAGVDAADA
ncbi:hypothetical protein BJ322DRAFT_1083849 [Thelephora terrestris]|uniref:Protein kinase domain-containing protein n=1 Tax=Thelephora terrestris TaxID=56493 RepID=A0A9P6H6K5_9AGAM|nr:hypothetical protein BJ322DRAFT_1083849 [Thelephora terrestris]